MKLIRLPKLVDIAERELPELVLDWMNTKSVQNINIRFVQMLWVNMLISSVIECSTSWMPHCCPFRNFTHRAWAIWDISNHELFWMIPNPSHQKRITSSLESISTIPFQVGTRYVKIPECGEHYSNRAKPRFVGIFVTFRGTWNQPNRDPPALLGLQLISFWILPITRYSGKACNSPEILVVWVFSDAQMTGMIVAPPGSWCCVSNHQSLVFISVYIWPLSRSVSHASSNSRCTWNGGFGERN